MKRYFANAVRRDVKWAILHHIRMLQEIPIEVRLAAHRAAFETAYSEAQMLVSEGLAFSVEGVFGDHTSKAWKLYLTKLFKKLPTS